MLRARPPFLVLFFLCRLVSAAPIPLAVVNGQGISEEEATHFRMPGEISLKPAVDKAILFRLALEAARAQGLDQDPELRREMDKALYKGFLQKKLAIAGQTLEPSEADLRARYEKQPLVRVRHLFLPARNEVESKKALAVLAEIQKLVAQGADFQPLVLKHSRDDSARWGGDLDFRGVNTLPETFYRAALSLKKGQLSKVLTSPEAVHLIQLIDLKPFAQAFAPYLQFLRTELRNEREETFLSSVLTELKRDAKIEILSPRSQSE